MLRDVDFAEFETHIAALGVSIVKNNYQNYFNSYGNMKQLIELLSEEFPDISLKVLIPWRLFNRRVTMSTLNFTFECSLSSLEVTITSTVGSVSEFLLREALQYIHLCSLRLFELKLKIESKVLGGDVWELLAKELDKIGYPGGEVEEPWCKSPVDNGRLRCELSIGDVIECRRNSEEYFVNYTTPMRLTPYPSLLREALDGFEQRVHEALQKYRPGDYDTLVVDWDSKPVSESEADELLDLLSSVSRPSELTHKWERVAKADCSPCLVISGPDVKIVLTPTTEHPYHIDGRVRVVDVEMSVCDYFGDSGLAGSTLTQIHKYLEEVKKVIAYWRGVQQTKVDPETLTFEQQVTRNRALFHLLRSVYRSMPANFRKEASVSLRRGHSMPKLVVDDEGCLFLEVVENTPACRKSSRVSIGSITSPQVYELYHLVEPMLVHLIADLRAELQRVIDTAAEVDAFKLDVSSTLIENLPVVQPMHTEESETP